MHMHMNKNMNMNMNIYEWTSETVKSRVRYTLVRRRRPWFTIVGWCFQCCFFRLY